MTDKIHIIWLLLLMGVTPVAAVTPYTPSHPDPVQEFWRWRSFPELKGQGLSCLAQDGEGDFWFGTDDGVHRYDGTTWRNFPFGDGTIKGGVNTLYAARDGSVYVGTDQGISRLKDGIWERVFPAEGNYRCITWDLTETKDGSLWAGTEWGALRLTTEGATLYMAEEDTAGIRQVVSGAVSLFPVPHHMLVERPWPFGIGAGIMKSGSNPGIVFKLAPGGPAEKAGLKIGDRVLSSEENQAEDGKVEVVLKLQRLDSRDEVVRIEKEQISETYHEFMVHDICEEPNGRIWFGNYRGDLVRFDPSVPEENGSWRRFTREDGIDQGMMPKLCAARGGIVWAVYGDNSKSVNRFDGEKWEAIEVGNLGRGHHFTSILESRDGTLWIGGSRLIAHKNGDWRVYDPKEVTPLPAHRTQLLEAADGALWIMGRGQEAARLDLGTDHWQTYEGLIFQCETPDGAQWFIAQDEGVVRYDGQRWIRFGVEDGMMDAPSRLMVTQDGALWAAGSHEHVAATARLDGSQWLLERHPRLSWTIDPRAVYEAFDGTLWFGAMVDWWFYQDREYQGGVLVFDGVTWVQHSNPKMTNYAYGIGQTPDGVLWFGAQLYGFDGTQQVRYTGPELLTRDFIDVVYMGPSGQLWLGSRTYGVFRHDATTWQRFDYRDGLADNRIQSILQDQDGTVWVATPDGYSRFDGRSWIPHALPETLPPVELSGWVLQSQDGAIWLNAVSGATPWLRRSEPRPSERVYMLRTIRYVPEATAPETQITIAQDEVSQSGNITLAWAGVDPWRTTPDESLRYAWRLDGGEWSPYAADVIQSFEHLPVGHHSFEVKARDLAFNEDPTPVLVQFSVIPPVWRRSWFIGLILVFVSITGYQATRIFARDRKLRQANDALSSANKALHTVNMDLKHEMEERARLDDQLQHLRYLYRLRTELDPEKSPSGVIRRVGETMMSVLGGIAGAGVTVAFDGREWTFGASVVEGVKRYERAIAVSGNPRGMLELHCGIALTEGQERALLDETAGQLARVLEARELEMQLLQSARLVSLGQMAAGVAHELNQPLTVIETTAGDICLRLMDGLPLETDELREMMEQVRGVVERMAGTVDHLRVFSREETQEARRAVCLNEVIQSSLTMIGTQMQNHGIELTLDLADDLPKVWGHPHPLEQVLVNLLANARDAVDERGGAETGHAKRIELRTRIDGDRVIAEVSDNGVGMDETARQRVFEPFYTTKEADRGTGLGMSIAYAILRNHEGTIVCESESGSGTTFRVSLPAASEEGKHV